MVTTTTDGNLANIRTKMMDGTADLTSFGSTAVVTTSPTDVYFEVIDTSAPCTNCEYLNSFTMVVTGEI